MKTPVNSQGHLQHYIHTLCGRVWVCVKGEWTLTLCACMSYLDKICTSKILSVDLCVYRYMSVYISSVYNVSKNKNLKVVLFKRRETRFQATQLFSVCSVHSDQRAPVRTRRRLPACVQRDEVLGSARAIPHKKTTRR